MDPVKDYEDVLKSIETAVIGIWRKQPGMNNYAVMRAYDAAVAHYVAVARQQTPKAANLTGLDATLFEAVRDVCDWRLGLVRYADRPQVSPVPPEDMVACLRRLRKSVDFWTEQGGRQGYMEYIEKFIG
ncbi:MAG: hypothetical protein ACLQM8_02475 [Limisphaerales bacterium]